MRKVWNLWLLLAHLWKIPFAKAVDHAMVSASTKTHRVISQKMPSVFHVMSVKADPIRSAHALPTRTPYVRSAPLVLKASMFLEIVPWISVQYACHALHVVQGPSSRAFAHSTMTPFANHALCAATGNTPCMNALCF